MHLRIQSKLVSRWTEISIINKKSNVVIWKRIVIINYFTKKETQHQFVGKGVL